MPTPGNEWVLLTYRIPNQPTRLRLQVWRKLQAMGAVWLQDAVCVLPMRPDLAENMDYIAQGVKETGGTCHLFTARALLPGSDEQIAAEFRAQTDVRLAEVVERLRRIETTLEGAADLAALERVEADLKQQRVAYLRARRLSYFGGTREAEVDALLDELRGKLDELYRGGK